jgi:hypothetical protein
MVVCWCAESRSVSEQRLRVGRRCAVALHAAPATVVTGLKHVAGLGICGTNSDSALCWLCVLVMAVMMGGNGELCDNCQLQQDVGRRMLKLVVNVGLTIGFNWLKTGTSRRG